MEEQKFPPFLVLITALLIVYPLAMSYVMNQESPFLEQTPSQERLHNF